MTRSKTSLNQLLAATVCGALCFVVCSTAAISAPRKLPLTPEMRAKGVTEAKVTSDGAVQYLINDQWHDEIPKTTPRGGRVTATGKPGNIGRTPDGTTAVGGPDAQGNRPVVFNDGRTGLLLPDGSLKGADENGKPIIKRPGQGWTYQKTNAPVPQKNIPTRNTGSTTTTVAPPIAPPIAKTTNPTTAPVVSRPAVTGNGTGTGAGSDLGSLLQSGPSGGYRSQGVGRLTGESR